METSRNPYNQRVEVSFSALETAAPATEPRRRHRSVRTVFAALPSALATLRKVMFDLTAVALPFVVAIFFFSIVTDETIIIEVPSVPQALQERGITPELLTRMTQLRVKEIHASVRSLEISTRGEPGQVLPVEVTPELVSMQIDQIYRSFGLPPPLERANGLVDLRVTELDETFARSTDMGVQGPDAALAVKALEFSDADIVIRATQESLKEVIGPYIDHPGVTKTTELAGPEQDPLVLATAGFHLSLDSLAHWVRGTFGIGTQRRLTVSLLCKTAGCGDGALVLHVVASAERAVAATADSNIGQLDQLVDAAASHLFESFDPQVLARHRFWEGKWEEARKLAERVLSQRHGQGAWAHNLLGLIEMRKEHWDAAKKPLEAAVTMDPEYVPAHVNLGVVHFRKGEFEDATDQYKIALELDPEHVVAYTNLGNARFRMCRWKEAADAYERALEVDPRYLPAQTSLYLIRGLPALGTFFFEGSKPENKPLMLDKILGAASFCASLASKP